MKQLSLKTPLFDFFKMKKHLCYPLMTILFFLNCINNTELKAQGPSSYFSIISPTVECINVSRTWTISVGIPTGATGEIGCFTVQIPTGFTSLGTPVITQQPNPNLKWVISRSGNTITSMCTNNGVGNRIGNGETLIFTITATTPAVESLPLQWTTMAGDPINCSANNYSPTSQPTVTIGSVAGTTSTTTPSLCLTNAASLSVSGYVGTIQWQRKGPSDPSFSDILGANGATLSNIPTTVGTWQYQVVVTNGSCGSKTSTPPTSVTVNASVGGTMSNGDFSFCQGGNIGTLSLQNGSYSGTSFQWQLNALGAGFQNITGATGTSYTNSSPVATPGTYIYRVVVTNGVCASSTSSTVTVTVNANSVGGSVSGTSTICEGTNTGDMTLSGQTGAVLTWQQKIGAGTFTDIPMSAGYMTWSDLLTIPGTYYYRAVVQNGSCPSVNSVENTITVSPASVGGSLGGGSSPICFGSSTGALSLSGETGTVTTWQKRLSPAGTFTDIPGTSGQTMWAGETPSSAGTWEYRVVVTSGACASSTSSVVSIVVDAQSVGGTITGGKSPTCTGDNIGTLILSGYTGSLQWQKDENGMGYMDISGATNPSYSETINTVGTYNYRVVVTNGACASSTSNVATIVVEQSSIGGVVTGGIDIINLGESTGLMTLSGYTGIVLNWQKRVNFGSYTDFANTTDTYQETPISTGLWDYRAVIKNGSCPIAYSVERQIDVQTPLPVELTRFTATKKGTGIELKWVTASEFNNNKFIIERSADALAFKAIGEVNGNGTTQLEHEYRFMDNNPVLGLNYYRLQQLDYNGNFEYGPVKVVMCDNSSEILIYPTITDGELHIVIPEGSSNETKLSIYNLSGRLVFSQAIDIAANAIINLPPLAQGQYIVSVANGKLLKRTRIYKD
ncbi:MAG: T9SS type A sorting domain-containing protein [Bacteroidetes bacterium]|nr:T9SS type A sorting domain-containing protein [Bacteroidota bacterium]